MPSLLTFSLLAVIAGAQAAWSIAFAQESFILSAVLLSGIALSLAVGVASLSSFKVEAEKFYFSIPFWTVHFPIGLHGGWTLAGESQSSQIRKPCPSNLVSRGNVRDSSFLV